MIRFEHDDPGYLDWVNRHPEGYVLNVRDRPYPQYVVLHRATCKTVSRGLFNPAGYTGGSYRKAVTKTKDGLRDVSIQNGRVDGSFSKECARCSPS